MKKLLFLIFHLALCSSIPAKEFVFNCVNPDNNNFQSNYIINDDLISRILGRSLFHKNSYSPLTKQKFEINEYYKIFSFKDQKIITIQPSQNGKVINLLIFDLSNKSLTQSGHFLNKLIKPNAQFFYCD
tara:strand:- start:387 stop:773 length:387 start_codon:yes stop_codon:yes gene_type:complete